jgi:cytochrome c oxidase subunit 1
MATTTVEGALSSASHDHEETSYIHASKGLKSWLYTIDHKRIGMMYLGSVWMFFFIAGILALLFRIELLTPNLDFLLAFVSGENAAQIHTKALDLYNKIFTLHGGLMVFAFIVPSIPASLGNFFLPLMLGAKDVAFPKLNLASYYLYWIGGSVLIYAIIYGGLDTGWTFYTPYSTTTGTAVTTATAGVFIMGFSSILTGLNFIVTIHKMRAPGMTWNRMPLFIWAIYATSVIQILATPVLAITLLLLIMERTLGIGIFDPAMGGDPVLFQHFFWFYSHPAVYIMILPAFGVISEIIAVHSKKHIFGYKAIAFSSVAIAIISFLVWGHHLFVSGQSDFAAVLFSFLTFAVAVPTAIKVFSWVATLYKGSISLNTAMIYGLMFIFTFTIGGLTGVFLGALAIDIHLHDTYFVVAHFHYVMMGGTVIAFLGAIHHWWPKMTGRMYNETWGRIASVIVFIGFNLTFFPQFIAGTQGMPRRYATYLDQFQIYHELSTIGSLVLGTGLLIVLIYLLVSLKNGKKAGPNPWGGASLEWSIQSPPIEHNFHQTPHVDTDPYNFPNIDRTAVSGHH